MGRGLMLIAIYSTIGFYERSKDEGGWGKQLSYIYFIDSEGNEHDITNRYTDTGTLILHVEKDGEPVENAKITIKSRFLMETDPRYESVATYLIT
jgi:hypothetical protein